MAQITKDTIIGDILDIAPETAPIFLSIGIGYISCIGGLLFSYSYQIPSGAAIIFISIIIYALSKLFLLAKKKKAQ